MRETKRRISSAIDRARADLEEALFELEKLPAVSEDAVGFAAHALNNFLTVTGDRSSYWGLRCETIQTRKSPNGSTLCGVLPII